MHADVRESAAAECPKCGMKLLPEGTRFAFAQSKIPVLVSARDTRFCTVPRPGCRSYTSSKPPESKLSAPPSA
jgi:heavy metal-binding protein